MGSVLTPLFVGLDKTKDLPNACTLNGRCNSVCPVKIPLNELLRKLRNKQFEQGLGSPALRWGLGGWAFLAKRPTLYHALTGMFIGVLSALGRKRGRFASFPLAGGWTSVRDLPAPQGETFMAAWNKRKRGAR
jgi:L-lactate dehydrogenase complex protein LldF